MTELTHHRLLSTAMAAGSGLVLPTSRVVSDLAGIDAYGARKMQTRHGAYIGHQAGKIAAIPLTLWALKRGKLKIKDVNTVKKALAKYVRHIGVPSAIGAATGAYIWHGGEGDVEKLNDGLMDKVRDQLAYNSAISAAMKAAGAGGDT
jgi:hypothetical protein